MRRRPYRIPILLLLCFLVQSRVLLSQDRIKDYNTEWKKVDALVEKERPQSALEEVKKIYALARKDEQDAQVIKSLVFMIGLQAETREDNTQKAIAEVGSEIAQAREPARSVLYNLLAGIYWNYFQEHRWQLYDRTNTTGFKKEDIATWTADDFHEKISELFQRSIAQKGLLQKTSLPAFDAIIAKGNMRHLRPTLYDLLVHRALSYFKNDERILGKPARVFEIDQAAAFDPAETFIHYAFRVADSTDLQYQAVLIYQQLLAFHQGDPKPDALIDADIDRLNYIYSKSVHPEKKALYRRALEHIAHQYENLPAASQAWYLMAAQYNEDASSYEPYGDTTHRFDRVRAKEICEKVLAQKDSSEGKLNCRNLLQQIASPEMRFSIEKVNLPGLPFRILIKYKNARSAFLRVVRMASDSVEQNANYYNDVYWKSLIKMPALVSWQQDLPATNDFQVHSVEIKADALPQGEYLLLASTEKDFNLERAVLGAQRFYVSNISFVEKDQDYFLLHRSSGKPLVGARAIIWQESYDYNKRRNILNVRGAYQADQHGFFHAEENGPVSGNLRLQIHWGQDTLFVKDPIYRYYYRGGRMVSLDMATRVFYFLDRSIYRPGQTLYFKGIAVSKDTDGKSQVKRNLKSWTYLENSNGETIDSVMLTSNDFGSFSGKFQLPSGTLNGFFNIRNQFADNGVNFSVEEYKRPKFYVGYDTLRKSYKLNDTIRVTGFARAYSGNNIDGATVKYRVVREPRFLYPWLTKRFWLPPTPPQEISHGIITTDPSGQFIVNFPAIPDRSIDPKLEPVFDYRLYADVTDINGETRSASTLISAGYKSLVLVVDLPEAVPSDSLHIIGMRTENLSGVFQPATAHVIIRKLKSESRLVHDRYWERPDQFVMSKSEYIYLFPHDVYDNEKDPASLPVDMLVVERSDSLYEHKGFQIPKQVFAPGYYQVEINVQDANGQAVKDIRYVRLYDPGTIDPGQPQYFWALPSRPVEPGEETGIKVGTSASDIFLIQQTERRSVAKNETSAFLFRDLNKKTATYSFAATESDRGGYGVLFLFVKDNRFYEFRDEIKVPWSDKELQIEYLSFRDKTLPGSDESWQVKIKGFRSEKIVAEMLASMYDGSLDQFRPHAWRIPSIWPAFQSGEKWKDEYDFSAVAGQAKWRPPSLKQLNKEYEDFNFPSYSARVFGYATRKGISAQYNIMDESSIAYNAAPPTEDMPNMVAGKVSGVTADTTAVAADFESFDLGQTEQERGKEGEFQPRKNFNETAFFFPDLRTDSSGAVTFSFTMPEATTKWKFQALAHTQALAMGLSTKEIVTQKELMVQPNIPRFLREGDRMELSTKIVNLGDSELTGQAQLLLFDAATNQPVDGWFRNFFPNQFFTVAPGQSQAIRFPIEVPYLFNKALTWRIVARSGNYSDGEEASIPVLTNKTLVTESLPIQLNGSGARRFTFDKLLHAEESETLQHHALTVEYTSNPVWYAVQALPYLMEYPYECAEQSWNRYYANALAARIANATPRIREIFDAWKTTDTAALVSNLEKNPELKSALLEETPWVLEARSESEQKKNIALLFDMARLARESMANLGRLTAMQSSNGGFAWFKGGPDDRYITQYILTGIGHLKKLGALPPAQQDELAGIVKPALVYLDDRIREDYEELTREKVNLNQKQIGSLQIQYLYMRSFFTDYPVAAKHEKAFAYYRGQARRFWTGENKFMQGMIALSLHRSGDSKTPTTILRSLKERALHNDESGMYWKDLNTGWFWHQAPIETQALLIEAFDEIANDQESVNALRTWLLKNKQTNRWETTKATADACYVLLMKGTDWIAPERQVTIKLGDRTITPESTEAGTGYVKQTIGGEFVHSEMGQITVSTESSAPADLSPSWGAIYWQYFENLDQIKSAATPLQLNKNLFVERNTDRGPVLDPVTDGYLLHVGDKVKVRVELRVDRDMEYVHMKDMRASCMEPVNVLSGYRWQGGLGYYESTKDASTNFFFNWLPKGTYVFEYTLFVTHAGDFSNGITTIQCMYAPEYSAHSEGVRVSVE